jgi:hypothetical protein
VQNKLHWAVTGKTAAELIAERADAEKPSMGLTTWKNAPKGKILKERRQRRQELPDRARDQGARAHRVDVPRLRRESGRAADPDEDGRLGRKLDAFLQFNEYEVLANAGKVSAEVAKRLAEEQYDRFRVRQDRELRERLRGRPR